MRSDAAFLGSSETIGLPDCITDLSLVGFMLILASIICQRGYKRL